MTFKSFLSLRKHRCIPEAVASVLSDSDQPFVFVYKDNNDKTTYLPDPPAWGMEVLDKMCSR